MTKNLGVNTYEKKPSLKVLTASLEILDANVILTVGVIRGKCMISAVHMRIFDIYRLCFL